MRNDNENLNELLGRFFEGQEASKAADDLWAGREIFETYSAPAPDAETIKNIKAQVSQRLTAKTRRAEYTSIAYHVAIAASIVIVALAGSRFFEQRETAPIKTANAIAGQIWEDETMNGDIQLAYLTAEIEDIEETLLLTRLDEYEEENSSILDEIEIEMISMNGDFWKG